MPEKLLSMKTEIDLFNPLKYQVNTVFDWVLPAVCPATGQLIDSHGLVSFDLWRDIHFITDPKCASCGVPFPYQTGQEGQELICGECIAKPKLYDRASSAILYNDASRSLILKYKHGDKTQMTPIFVPWMMRAGQGMLAQCDMVMPVPLHPFRLLRRLYNQSGLLASAIAQMAGRPYDALTLRRVIHTAPQGNKGVRSRKSNVSKAFDIKVDRSHICEGKHIVLVDDVLTSGATVEACAKTLKKAGAASVSVLTLARVTR